VGDTLYQGIKAVLISSTDSIVAHGEGNEGQHRILLAATGAGKSELFLDVAGGRLLGSSTTDVMDFHISTSGQLSHFRQNSTISTTLVPTP